MELVDAYLPDDDDDVRASAGNPDRRRARFRYTSYVIASSFARLHARRKSRLFQRRASDHRLFPALAFPPETVFVDPAQYDQFERKP